MAEPNAADDHAHYNDVAVKYAEQLHPARTEARVTTAMLPGKPGR